MEKKNEQSQKPSMDILMERESNFSKHNIQESSAKNQGEQMGMVGIGFLFRKDTMKPVLK